MGPNIFEVKSELIGIETGKSTIPELLYIQAKN
jgi:hypothetical protein